MASRCLYCTQAGINCTQAGISDDRYRTLLGAFSAVADRPTVKAVLHSLRGVLASTSKLHGVELYLLSNDGQTLASFEFDRDDDAPAIIGAEFLAETAYSLDVCERLHLPLVPKQSSGTPSEGSNGNSGPLRH